MFLYKNNSFKGFSKRAGNTVLFNKNYHQNEESPVSGGLIIDQTGAISGNVTKLWYSGAIKPNITGASKIIEMGVFKPNIPILIVFEWSNYNGGTYIVNYISGNGFSENDITPPVMSNFRIISSEPTRIYFNTSEPILMDSELGFGGITGKSITGYFVANGALDGHYLLVDVPFTSSDENILLNYNKTSGTVRDYSDNGLTINHTFNVINELSGSFVPIPFSLIDFTESPTEYYTSTAVAYNSKDISNVIFSGDFDLSIHLDNETDVKGVMIGLTENATNSKWNESGNEWDFMTYIQKDTSLIRVAESGVVVDTSTTATYGSAVRYRFLRTSGTIYVYLDNTLVYTFPTTNTNDMYFHISHYGGKVIKPRSY